MGDTCQRTKYETVASLGLLSPLPIRSVVVLEILMDFIGGLPKSRGTDIIFVVVVCLTKFGNFMAITHPFSVVRLYDLEYSRRSFVRVYIYNVMLVLINSNLDLFAYGPMDFCLTMFVLPLRFIIWYVFVLFCCASLFIMLRLFVEVHFVRSWCVCVWCCKDQVTLKGENV